MLVGMGRGDLVFGVDLDGVCADFIGSLRPYAAEWLGKDEGDLPLEVSYGFAEWGLDNRYHRYEDLHRWAVREKDLFRNLLPIDGAAQALRRLSEDGVRIRIITHRLYIPYAHRSAVTQTVEWLDRYGFPYWDLCFMKDKGAVGADLYIEDSPANIAVLRESGAEVIVFDNSTNRELEPPRARTWQEVEELVRARL